jgi:hypothetical protein
MRSPVIAASVAAVFALLAALPAPAGTLEVRLSVLDPASFEQRPPQAPARWLIRGGPGLVIAEERAPEPQRSIDLPPGAYEVTVWEVESGAAAGFTVRVDDGTTGIAALLSPTNAAMIPDEADWQAALQARPQPAPAAPSAAPEAPRTAAPEPARVAAPAPAADPHESPRAMRLGLVVAPGAPVRVLLPRLENAADDLITLSDGGPGWIAEQARGARDEATLSAPETTGRYRIDYLAVPSMEVLATIELEVR